MYYNAGSCLIYATESFLQTSLPGQQPQIFHTTVPEQGLGKWTLPCRALLAFPLWLAQLLSLPAYQLFWEEQLLQSTTGNDPNCFVPLGQSKHALV